MSGRSPMASRVSLFAVALLQLIEFGGCTRATSPPQEATRDGSPARAWFTDRARDAGIDFVHLNGMSGRFYDAEIFPPGLALFDYDNDGDLDLYAVQGQTLGAAGAATPPRTGAPLTDRLYRNDLTALGDGTRVLRFTDVTATTGIDVRSYGMGVAAGDFNNDGWVDLYLTRLGPNVMLRNNGDGTFTDVTRQTGTGDRSWGVSAAFVDIDRDGWLDLYVGNYLQYTVETDVNCTSVAGEPDYCDPSAYRPARDRLYRNQRDGTFRDVTDTALVGGPHGAALGVSTADFDGDGWIDVYVANDRRENDLWMNQRDGTFRNTALLAGAALNADGRVEASMGVDAGDFDNDGDEDIVITNFTSEGITLYRNDGSGRFEDVGPRSGLRPRSLASTGFGAAWVDLDNDGWLDLLTVNGAVKTLEALARARDPFPFGQANQVFRNLRNGRFEDVTELAPVLRALDVSRGAAFGDLDNDGDVDVAVANNNGPVRLLINEIGNRRHWAGFRLIGAEGRNLLGSLVEVIRDDGQVIRRRARADGSYASANDPRVLVGLGDSTGIARVRVLWASGRSDEWTDIAIDRWTRLEEGTGR
ncbi:MAG: CRTAC1 family protein [Acidobacteria bacterium]|nr:CRTAC1 family protein [Acidobacteriota bacterium]